MHPSPDILALLALGESAGTPAERDHVASCRQCRDEVADLARTVAVGRGSTAEDGTLVRPSDRVWQAIRAELGFDSTDPAETADVASVTPLHRPSISEHRTNAAESGPPVTATPAGAEPGQGRGRRLLSLALAAALALVVGVGLGFGLDRLLDRQTILWTAELQALPAYSGSSGEAAVEEDADGNKTLVIELNAPRPVNGSQEVWLIDRGVTTTRSLGHLTPGSNRFNIPADLDPRQFPIVDVSAEPPNDTEPRHSGNSIVRGTLNV
jgi:hypothetical protein